MTPMPCLQMAGRSRCKMWPLETLTRRLLSVASSAQPVQPLNGTRLQGTKELTRGDFGSLPVAIDSHVPATNEDRGVAA
jgi:hypothetical protein